MTARRDPPGLCLAQPERKVWPWVLGAIGALLVVGTVVFVLWATNPPPPGEVATAALVSDADVVVSHDDGYTFTPTTPSTTGFVFYPGARVDPGSYAMIAHELAADGYLVVIPEVPLNMAVFQPNIADDVIAAHPEIDQWVIGGHSLGGAMAASYTNTHRDTIAGLVFWAAYPANNVDLTDYDGVVTSISGSRDGLATPDKIADSRTRLPADTTFVVIDGGDHAQFGDYGAQSGDNPATIPPAEQWDQITAATVDVLDEVSGAAN